MFLAQGNIVHRPKAVLKVEKRAVEQLAAGRQHKGLFAPYAVSLLLNS